MTLDSLEMYCRKCSLVFNFDYTLHCALKNSTKTYKFTFSFKKYCFSTYNFIYRDVDDESIPLAIRKKWVPRMLGPLPPMFLRIPPGTDARIDLSLEMDDDRIATFLQNEEFMAELRWNQEFMAALDSEQGQKTKGHDDEAAFKERLKNMGKCKYSKFYFM